MVDIKSGTGTIKLALFPSAKTSASRPGHQKFWLTDWLRSMVDQLAKMVSWRLPPDFLNGQKFEDRWKQAKRSRR